MRRDLSPPAGKVKANGTRKMRHVLKTLEEADKLSDDVDWDDELWEDCTVEEVIGALYEQYWSVA